MLHGAVAWLSDPKHPNYEAAARAIAKVYDGQEPDYTREGGSIPITTAIEEATGMVRRSADLSRYFRFACIS